MNDFQKQKYGMYDTVLTLLSENRDIVSTVRSFTSSSTKLRKIMDDIRRIDKAISSEILDKTIKNASAKDELINSLTPIISALFNYSRESNQIELREKTRLSKSHLVRMLDNELTYKAELISKLAVKYLKDLKKFKITQADISTLNEKTGIFKNTLENKVSSLISSATVMILSDLFSKADDIMAIMDQFVETLEDEYTEFYDEYIFSRDIENQDEKKALKELEEEDDIQE